jgi:hypothetical protein
MIINVDVVEYFVTHHGMSYSEAVYFSHIFLGE